MGEIEPESEMEAFFTKQEWIKDVQITYDGDIKVVSKTIIDENNPSIVKEDVLNSMDYNRVSTAQQMVFHAFKKIEEVEVRIVELEKLEARIIALEKP